MNMKDWLNQAYTDEIVAVEAAYEELMKEAENQHRARMDMYAKMRTETLARVGIRYGLSFAESAAKQD